MKKIETFCLFGSLGTNGLTSIIDGNVERCNSDKFILLFFEEANGGFKLCHGTGPHLKF